MFRLLTLISIATTWLMVVAAADARVWPDGKGGTCDAELILVRTDDVVLRPKKFRGTLLVVPKNELRKVDLSYLSRKVSSRTQVHPADLPEVLRAIVDIHDAESLLHAATFFRGRDMPFVRETFSQYVRLEAGRTDQLWYLARVIFEHGPGQRYPDFDKYELSLTQEEWCGCGVEDVKLSSGLPFIWRFEGNSSGPNCPFARPLLAWVNTHARLRDPWIRPDAPASEFFTALLKHDQGYRHQAWRLVDQHFDANWQCVFEESLDDERWAKVVELIVALKLKWDDEKQQFIPHAEAPLPRPPEEWIPTELIHASW